MLLEQILSPLALRHADYSVAKADIAIRAAATETGLPAAKAPATSLSWAEANNAPVSQSYVFVDDVVVGEDKTFVDVTIRLHAPNLNTATVDFYTYSGSATTADYVYQDSQVTFAAGETVQTVRINLTPDVLAEGDHVFYLYLNATSANVTRADDTAEIRIIDNDAPTGTPNASVSSLIVDEQAGTATFVVTLDRPSAGTVTMNYATQNGTATAGSDFVSAAGSLVFASGEVVKTVTVQITDDALIEGNETFRLALSNLAGATSINPAGTATIWASDAAPVSMSNAFVDNIVVGEDRSYVDVTIRLDRPNLNVATVDWYTDSETATTADYAYGDSFVTFMPGETVRTVRIELFPDSLVEGDHVFNIVLNRSSANVTIADPVAEVRIVDNDAPTGTPNVSIADVLVDEQQGTATFVIVLDRPSTGTVSFDYATQNGTATAGADYVAASGSLVFGAGEVVRTVTVQIINDSVEEVAESFRLALGNLNGVTAAQPFGTATIGANDAPAVSQSFAFVDNIVVGEDRSYVDVTIRLDRPNLNTATVDYYTNSATATTADYAGQDSFVTFAAGETVKTVRIVLYPDALVEGDHVFNIVLNNSSANVTIADPVAEVRIVDNDAPTGTPNASVTSMIVDEQAGTATFIVTLDCPSVSTVTMDYATQNVSALAGSDYVATAGSLVFLAGQVAQTVTVRLLDDAVAEANEAFQLNLSNLSGATSQAPSGTAIIWANDTPAVSQSNAYVDDVVVSEDRTYVDVTIRLDHPNLNAGWVDFYTVSGTATTSDYASQDSFVRFLPGETVKTVRILLYPDSIVEGDHVFSVVLNASSANITRADGTAEIRIIETPVSQGTPLADNIVGTGFNDIAFAYAGNDTIDGGAGNDSLYAGEGHDSVLGGDGDDIVEGYLGNDTLAGGLGNDTLNGYAGDDQLSGGDGNDQMTGSGGRDLIDGGNGADVVNGGAANDTLLGGAGGDTLEGSGGSDEIRGGGGLDILIGGLGLDLIYGDADDDQLFGNAGADTLNGGTGNDTIYAGSENDWIYGNAGNDHIYGGTGRDVSTGGTGADTFYFNTVDFAGPRGATAERITDFSQADGDVIDLSAIDARTGLAGNQAFTFIGNAAFGNVAGQLRYVFDAGNTYVEGDRNGDGTADFALRLDGLIALTPGDFVL